MFCAMEDIGRGLQRFCWPPTTSTTAPGLFPVTFDHRSILPTMMIPSPSKSYAMPSFTQQQQQQQIPIGFSPDPRHALTIPFQHLGNFVIPSAQCSTSPVADRDDHTIRRRYSINDEARVRRNVDRRRHHPSTIENGDMFVDSIKENGEKNNEISCGKPRSTTTTSFTIADILEGRIGNADCSNKRRRTESPLGCDRSPSISAADGCRVGDEHAISELHRVQTSHQQYHNIHQQQQQQPKQQPSSELVRPWKQSRSGTNHSASEDAESRRSSSSSIFSPSPVLNNNYSEDENEEDNDDDDDEEEEDIDVDDAGSVGNRQSSTHRSTSDSVCPLGALLRMTSETNFDASSGSGLQECLATFDDSASDGNGSSYESRGHHISRRTLFPVSTAVADAKCFRSCRKRRKTRTAFTNQQIAELERWFGRQKYLTPADRDEIAASLRLSAAQVITWFQNRRAKLKRDLEELKADVAAAKALGTEPSTAVLDRLAELTKASALQQQATPPSSNQAIIGKMANDSEYRI